MDFTSFHEIEEYVQKNTFDRLLERPLKYLAQIYGCILPEDTQGRVQAINKATDSLYAIVLGDTVYEEVRDIKDNWGQYVFLHDTLLADEFSRSVLASLLAFRLTRLNHYILNAFDFKIQQYFDPSVSVCKKDCVYVDCGALDGYTAARFILRCPSYKRIYAYEPIEKYHQECKENIDELQAANIVLRKAAVCDKNTILRFSINEKGSSKADESGEIAVQGVALDEDISEPVGFIKMDIEGSEKAALRGAERHIRNDAPMLAICVYHRPCDMREIPLMIRNMNEGYRFFLRHHQYNPNETVLYAIPTKGELSTEGEKLPSPVEAACRRLTERLELNEKAEWDDYHRYLITQEQNYSINTPGLLSELEELRSWAQQLSETKEYLSREIVKRDAEIEKQRIALRLLSIFHKNR